MINSMARSLITAKKWYRNVSAGNPLYSDYELISTTLITSNTASVTFDVTGLGSSYKHLQIRMAANSSASGATYWRFNTDSGNNYSQHLLYGNGSSVASGATTSTNAGYIGYTTNAASFYPATVIDVLDFASSTKNKTVRILHGDSGNIMLNSGAWYSTSAVTSVTLYANVNYIAGSRFSIYGVKG